MDIDLSTPESMKNYVDLNNNSVIAECQFQVKKLSEQLQVLQRKNAKMNRFVDAIDEKKTGGILAWGNKDLEFLHNGYKLLMLKVTVATELHNMLRDRAGLSAQINMKVIEAFDKEDGWWQRRKDYSLDQWLKTFKRLANK